jgi:hypothetical protein
MLQASPSRCGGWARSPTSVGLLLFHHPAGFLIEAPEESVTTAGNWLARRTPARIGLAKDGRRCMSRWLGFGCGFSSPTTRPSSDERYRLTADLPGALWIKVFRASNCPAKAWDGPVETENRPPQGGRTSRAYRHRMANLPRHPMPAGISCRSWFCRPGVLGLCPGGLRGGRFPRSGGTGCSGLRLRRCRGRPPSRPRRGRRWR